MYLPYLIYREDVFNKGIPKFYFVFYFKNVSILTSFSQYKPEFFFSFDKQPGSSDFPETNPF